MQIILAMNGKELPERSYFDGLKISNSVTDEDEEWLQHHKKLKCKEPVIITIIMKQ